MATPFDWLLNIFKPSTQPQAAPAQQNPAVAQLNRPVQQVLPPAPQPSQPTGPRMSAADLTKLLGQIAISSAQAIPQAPIRVAETLQGKNNFQPDTPFAKAILGDQPIANLQDYSRQAASNVGSILTGGKNKTAGQGIPTPLALPLGLALTLSDVSPVKGLAEHAGLSFTKTGAEDVAKSGVEQAAKDVAEKTATDYTVPAYLRKEPDNLALAALQRQAGVVNDLAAKPVSAAEQAYKAAKAAQPVAEIPAFANQAQDIIANQFAHLNPITGPQFDQAMNKLSKSYDRELKTVSKMPALRQTVAAKQLEEKYSQQINDLNQRLDDMAVVKSASKDMPPEPKAVEPVKAPEPITEPTPSTSTNPKTVNLPQVAMGDYEKARGNAQLASNPIEVATRITLGKVKQLSKQEKGIFWKAVENPALQTSTALKNAAEAWRSLADTVHATSQGLGGETPYLQNYARHVWDLSNPEDAARFEQLSKNLYQRGYDPSNFAGLDNQPRVFDSVTQGENAGFKLKNPNNPEQDILDYGKGSAAALKKQALGKGILEADAGQASKPHLVDLGGHKGVYVSDKGSKELQSFNKPPDISAIRKAYSLAGHKSKQTVLSISQFHPININLLQAAPTLVGTPKDWFMGEGHAIRAVKGIADSAAVLASKKYSSAIIEGAAKDGTIEDAARIGTPILYGSDFTANGKLALGKTGIGERAIFERQLPAMHIQMVKAVVGDLKKRGISLDSIEARDAGKEVNRIMGYVNTELENFDLRFQRNLGDVALAPQFTRAKWQVIRDAVTKGGVAGNLARRAVIGKYTTEAAVSLAMGALVHQKSDNLTDILIRSLVHPSIPTPFQDSKGNNIELGMPHNFISEALNLVAKPERGTNGRLGLNFNPSNIVGNLENYGKARLGVVPSAGLKVLTNTNYAGKPLFDTHAPLGTQITQGATTLANDVLPIPAQGLSQLPAIKGVLPQASQDILNNNAPGKSPVLQSIAASLGLSPRTDKTVGKGLQTDQYFTARDAARNSLNANDQAAFDSIHPEQKNPVSGKYQVQPTPYDSATKAALYLQHPNVLAADVKLNQTLAKDGQKVDPFFTDLTDKQRTAYLQYEKMPPNGPDQIDWRNKNKWYSGFQTARSNFFGSLPPADPNKPQAALQFPQAAPQVKTLMDKYFKLPDSASRATFIKQYPELQAQFDAQDKYYNDLRVAQGYSAQKDYPQASPELQKFIDGYLSADASAKKSIRTSNPDLYKQMSDYFDKTNLYGIDRTAAVNNLKGEPDTTQSELKQVSNLGHDIYQNQDNSFSLVPAGFTQGLNNGYIGTGGAKGSSGSKSGRSSGGFRMRMSHSGARGTRATARVRVKAPKTSTRSIKGFRSKVA